MVHIEQHCSFRKCHANQRSCGKVKRTDKFQIIALAVILKMDFCIVVNNAVKLIFFGYNACFKRWVKFKYTGEAILDFLPVNVLRQSDPARHIVCQRARFLLAGGINCLLLWEQDVFVRFDSLYCQRLFICFVYKHSHFFKHRVFHYIFHGKLNIKA